MESPNLRRVLQALVFASAICLVLLVARPAIFGVQKFNGLAGNLVLAWVPVLFAWRIAVLHARHADRLGAIALCGVVWFFFFPNAPYLVTDLVHWKLRAPVPKWFDLILIMSFAWTGVSLGCLSLYLLQEIVTERIGRRIGWMFAIGMLALGSCGVFVGRYWRWNSWEAFVNPFSLFNKAEEKFDRLPPGEIAGFCLTFFCFSLLSYVTMRGATHLRGGAEPRASVHSAPAGKSCATD